MSAKRNTKNFKVLALLKIYNKGAMNSINNLLKKAQDRSRNMEDTHWRVGGSSVNRFYLNKYSNQRSFQQDNAIEIKRRPFHIDLKIPPVATIIKWSRFAKYHVRHVTSVYFTDQAFWQIILVCKIHTSHVTNPKFPTPFKNCSFWWKF